ncbi:hypothetical protein D3C72_2024980 [compost metagenome]
MIGFDARSVGDIFIFDFAITFVCNFNNRRFFHHFVSQGDFFTSYLAIYFNVIEKTQFEQSFNIRTNRRGFVFITDFRNKLGHDRVFFDLTIASDFNVFDGQA